MSEIILIISRAAEFLLETKWSIPKFIAVVLVAGFLIFWTLLKKKHGTGTGKEPGKTKGHSPQNGEPKPLRPPGGHRSGTVPISTLNPITIERIRLYATGVNGNVETLKFPKGLIDRLGIKLYLKNTAGRKRKVSIQWFIRDSGGRLVFQAKRYRVVKAYGPFETDLCFPKGKFSKMKIGTYRSQCCIDGKSVQDVEFRIVGK